MSQREGKRGDFGYKCGGAFAKMRPPLQEACADSDLIYLQTVSAKNNSGKEHLADTDRHASGPTHVLPFPTQAQICAYTNGHAAPTASIYYEQAIATPDSQSPSRTHLPSSEVCGWW